MKQLGSVFTLATALLLFGATAFAQQYPTETGIHQYPLRAPGVSVYGQERPEFEAEGVTAGNFMLFPSVVVGGYYDSNVFAASQNEESDFVSYVSPQVEAVTEHDRFRLRGRLQLGVNRFLDNSSQDTEEGEAAVDGRYRLSPGDEIDAGIAAQRQTVNREDVEEGGGTGDPRILHKIMGRVGYSGRRGPVTIDVKGRAVDKNFERGIQRDKDRTEYEAVGRIGYRASREFTPFVEPYVEVRDFDTAVDDNGFARDAHRAGVRAGTLYNLGERLSLEASVGGAQWEFDDSRFDSETIWTASGELSWNVTPLTTIKAGASRDAIASTISGSALREVIGGNIGIEHEFRRNILVFADVEYRNTEFDRITREDDDIDFGIGADYLFNKMFSASARYVRSERDSNNASSDFTRDIVWLSVRAQF